MSRNSPPEARTPAAAADVDRTTARFTSLDVLRGLTIAGMIVVNNQGDGAHVLPGLGHAKWNGLGLADLVFPFFLVIMGTSMAFSFGRARAPTSERILRRATILFALGFFLNAFPVFDADDVGIMGVLQRIGLVYLMASFLVLHLGRRAQYAIGAVLLLGYWAAMTLLGDLTPEGNLAGWFDRTILGAEHLYKEGPYDPQGLFSTLPAIVSTLIGFWAGDWLRRQPLGVDAVRRLVVAGIVIAAAGAAWHPLFPINKRLWTSSYVLVTAGLALVLLAATYYFVELRGHRRVGRPFEILGLNAILAYLAAEELHVLLVQTHWRGWLYGNVFEPLAGSAGGGSLVYALAVTAIVFAPAVVLYRRRIFLKV